MSLSSLSSSAFEDVIDLLKDFLLRRVIMWLPFDLVAGSYCTYPLSGCVSALTTSVACMECMVYMASCIGLNGTGAATLTVSAMLKSLIGSFDC